MANIDYVQRLLDRPDIRAAREAARRLDEAERITAPLQRVEALHRFVEPIYTSFSPPVTFSSIDSSIKLARRLDSIWEDFERALAPLRSLLSALPAPPRLPLFQREARAAWLSFHQGDPEPLDSFIRKYLARLKKHEGPVPEKLRKGVMGILDECFAPVFVYAPGDWYFFGSTAQEKLVEFAGENHKKYGSVSYVAGFEAVLKAAVIIAWDDIQWTTDSCTQTFLNRIDVHLRKDVDEGPKLLKHAEYRPHFFLDESSENPVAQFEAREAVKQQVRALPSLVERAALPPRERLFYGFDSRVGTDFDTIEEAGKAAADALNVDPSTVRTTRFRYRNHIARAMADDPRLREIFEEIAPDL